MSPFIRVYMLCGNGSNGIIHELAAALVIYWSSYKTTSQRCRIGTWLCVVFTYLFFIYIVQNWQNRYAYTKYETWYIILLSIVNFIFWQEHIIKNGCRDLTKSCATSIVYMTSSGRPIARKSGIKPHCIVLIWKQPILIFRRIRCRPVMIFFIINRPSCGNISSQVHYLAWRPPLNNLALMKTPPR